MFISLQFHRPALLSLLALNHSPVLHCAIFSFMEHSSSSSSSWNSELKLPSLVFFAPDAMKMLKNSILLAWERVKAAIFVVPKCSYKAGGGEECAMLLYRIPSTWQL